MITLHDYQIEVVEKIQADWVQHQSIMLQMPTGTGKTIVFAEIISRHLKEYPGKRILVLTHKRELVVQTFESLRSFGFTPGQIISGDDKNPDHRVQIATVQTLIRRKDKIKFLSNLSLIVIDEAHHAPSRTYRKLVSHYQSEHTHLLGVTATPRRTDGQGFKDIFQTLIKSWQIKRFISAGRLADIEHRKTLTYKDVSRQLHNISIDAKTNDYDEIELGELMSSDIKMADAVESYIRYRGNFVKSIVFAVNVKHSKALCERFIAKSIRAAHIDGTTDPKTRKNIVSDFRKGLISVLCNVGIITEGFDLPDTEIVQLVRPTKSITLYLQQVGRVMRIKPNGSHALILDSANCYDQHGSVKANRKWSLESNDANGWPESSDSNENALEPDAPIERDERMIKVDEPSFCPLAQEWFDTLHEEYKDFFRSRFHHLVEPDLKLILNAIWLTNQWDFSHQPISSINCLRKLTNTKTLNISFTECTSLRPVMSLKRLVSLQLVNTKIDLLRLPDEKQFLKRLNISKTKINDVSILSEYPLIEKLTINFLQLKSYAGISKLENIQRFSAKNSNFSSLETLYNSRNCLIELKLNNSNISDIAIIHHFHHLKFLDISGTQITSLARIRECRALETLVIKGLNIPKEELRELGNREPIVWIED